MIYSPLRIRRPSKQTLFVSLMILSAVLLCLPSELLGPARAVIDLVAVVQWPASQASQKVADLSEIGTPAFSAEDHASLLAELQARRNLTNSLQLRVAELEAKVTELSHLRSQPGFPREGRLIPADVMAADAVAARGSLLLSKGKTSRVRPGDAVTSCLFVDAGSDDGIRKGASVLGHEALIGWVEETEAFTSRVVLLSDYLAGRAMVVHIVREQKDGPPLVMASSSDKKPLHFPLQGAGRDTMKIPEIDARWVQEGYVRAGDLVMSSQNEPRLPVSLVIGQITSLEKVLDPRKKPLYYTATVKHRYDPRRLTRVFVADFSRDTGTRSDAKR